MPFWLTATKKCSFLKLAGFSCIELIVVRSCLFVCLAVFFYSDSCSTVTILFECQLSLLVMLFNEIKVSAGIEECFAPVKHSI
jgi:hypothetical protein